MWPSPRRASESCCTPPFLCYRILLPPLPLRLLHQHLRYALRLGLRRIEQLLRIVQLLPAALTRRFGLVLEIKGSEIVIGGPERTSAIPQLRWLVPSTFRDDARAKRLSALTVPKECEPLGKARAPEINRVCLELAYHFLCFIRTSRAARGEQDRGTVR